MRRHEWRPAASAAGTPRTCSGQSTPWSSRSSSPLASPFKLYRSYVSDAASALEDVHANVSEVESAVDAGDVASAFSPDSRSVLAQARIRADSVVRNLLDLSCPLGDDEDEAYVVDLEAEVGGADADEAEVGRLLKEARAFRSRIDEVEEKLWNMPIRLWGGGCDSDDYYDVSRGGVVAVFSQSKDRRGNQFDLDSIDRVFGAGGLGMRIEHFKDLTKSETESAHYRLKSSLCSDDWSYLVVVVLAHGGSSRSCGSGARREFFRAADGAEVDLRDFTAHYHNENCPKSFRGKPKIFLMGSCRGMTRNRRLRRVTATAGDGGGDSNGGFSAHQNGMETDAADSAGADRSWVGNVQDTYVLRSTVEGTACLRHLDQGTFFVQGVCHVLSSRPDAELEDLRRGLVASMNDEADRWTPPAAADDDDGGFALIPEATTTMVKKFRFCHPRRLNDARRRGGGGKNYSEE